MKRAIVLLLAVLLVGYAPLWADDSDWFSVSGVTFVEAVGTGTAFVLVSKDSSGGYHVLCEGDQPAPGMTIKKIGSQQVLVARGPGEQSAAPILRQQIPADALIAAICKLYNQNLVIGCEMGQMVAFSEGLLNYKKELPGLVGSLGFAFHADDRAIVIRKADAKAAMPAPGARKESYVQGLHVRVALSEVLAAIQKQTERVFKSKAGEGTVTVNASDLAPEELAAYLTACGTEVAEEAPKPVEAMAAPAPAPAAEASASDAIETEFRAAVAIAKGGDYRKAAAMLLKSLRAHKQVPAKVTNLLGKLLWHIGKKDMARKAWAVTLKGEPGNEFARRALAKTAALANQG